MIPKILHTLWLGNEKSNYDYRQRWQELMPNWSMIHWTEELADQQFGIFYKSFKGYVSRSDYLRLRILYEFGGVYVDMDVEPLRPLDSLLGRNVLIAKEDETYLCPAVFGAVRANSEIGNIVFHKASPSLEVPWGPKLLTKYLKSVEPVDTNYFFPYHWKRLMDKSVCDVSRSFCIHHWNSARHGFK